MQARVAGRLLIVLLPGVVLCSLWEWAAWDSARTRFLFGCPSLIWQYLVTYLGSGEGIWDTLITGGEASAGFVIGNTVGTCIGLCLAYFRGVQRVARPYVVILGSIPIFALAPLMIMWFGIGYLAKVMMAVFSTFLVTTVQAYSGATQADRDLVELVTSLGASRYETFKTVVVPSCVQWVVTSFRLTIGFALLGAFIGEFISAERGLGYRILKCGGLYDIPGVLGGIVMIAVLALVLNKGVDMLSAVLLRWR